MALENSLGDSYMRLDSKSTSESVEKPIYTQEPSSTLQLSANWLLWLGIGAAATANSMGASPIASLFIGSLFLTSWGLVGLTTQDYLRLGRNTVIELYFRRYMAMDSHHIPESGPVIFVCGPHSNQFLDPFVVARGTERYIRYIIAAKSMRRKDLGWLFKFTDPIPVERPQDIAVKGTGKVLVKGDQVQGFSTQFTKELQSSKKGRFQIQVIAEGRPAPMVVEKVLSDTELTLKEATNFSFKEPIAFKVLPPVSHDEMFEKVYEHLGAGGALGIFPEGGSHDRTTLLPLKVGVCLMALGTMDRYPGVQVKLVPVGLNYFSQDKFNSRVVVKYGQPVSIPPKLVELFSQGREARKQAVSDLLMAIQNALHEVIVEAPDWETMKSFWALRDLYTPTKRLVNMTLVQKVLLAQAFAADYDRIKDLPEVNDLLARVKEYARKLNCLGLKDRDNLETILTLRSRSMMRSLCLLLLRCLFICFMTLVLLPSRIVLLPAFLASIWYSRRMSLKALKASTVKIKAKDVVGTYKLIVALPLIIFGHFIYSWIIWYKLGETAAVIYYFLAPFLQFVAYKLVPFNSGYIIQTYSLFLALFKREDHGKLLEEREELKKDVRDIVDKLHWGYASKALQAERYYRKESIHSEDHVDQSMFNFGKQFSDSMVFLEEDINHDLLYKND